MSLLRCRLCSSWPKLSRDKQHYDCMQRKQTIDVGLFVLIITHSSSVKRLITGWVSRAKQFWMQLQCKQFQFVDSMPFARVTCAVFFRPLLVYFSGTDGSAAPPPLEKLARTPMVQQNRASTKGPIGHSVSYSRFCWYYQFGIRRKNCIFQIMASKIFTLMMMK